MRLWGTDVPNDLALDLVGMLRRGGFDSTATKISTALTWGETTVELTPLDRECLFRVLKSPPPGLVELRAALLMDRDDPPGTVLRCTECGCVSETAPGWVALIVEDPDEPSPPGIAAYCPPCAARVLEYAPRSGVYT